MPADEHHQTGWIYKEDFDVPLEPGQDMVDRDDRHGCRKQIMNATEAFRYRYMQELIYNEFRNSLNHSHRNE